MVEAVLKIKTDAADEKFLEKFHDENFSPLSFFLLFFALLSKRGIEKMKREFTDEFYKLKTSGKYEELMEAIKFKSNGIFYYSNQIENSIYVLQTCGVLGKKNPSFGEMFIELTQQDADEIVAKYNSDTVDKMGMLATEFIPNITPVYSKC